MRQPTVLQFNKIRTTKCSSFFLGDKFMKQQCVSPRNVSIRRSAQNISLLIGCVLVSSAPPEVPDGGLPQHICQSAHGGFRFLIHNVRTDAGLCQCYFQSFLRRNGGGEGKLQLAVALSVRYCSMRIKTVFCSCHQLSGAQ